MHSEEKQLRGQHFPMTNLDKTSEPYHFYSPIQDVISSDGNGESVAA